MCIYVSGNEKCLFKFCVRPKYVVPIQKYYLMPLSRIVFVATVNPPIAGTCWTTLTHFTQLVSFHTP